MVVTEFVKEECLLSIASLNKVLLLSRSTVDVSVSLFISPSNKATAAAEKAEPG